MSFFFFFLLTFRNQWPKHPFLCQCQESAAAFSKLEIYIICLPKPKDRYDAAGSSYPVPSHRPEMHIGPNNQPGLSTPETHRLQQAALESSQTGKSYREPSMKPSPVLEYMVICGGAQRCGIGADGRCIIRVHLQTFSDVFRHLSVLGRVNIRLLVVPKCSTKGPGRLI